MNTASRDDPARMPRSFYGWRLLAIFWFIVLVNLGLPMYGGSVLVSAMAAELHFSRQSLGMPFSVFFGTVGLSSPLVAWIIRRLGVRWTMTAGNVCVAIGACLMALVVRSAPQAALAFGAMIGFGVAAGGNLAAQTAIPHWFVRHRALAFALMLTASATGGFIAPPLLTAVIRGVPGGWRTGWVLLAAAALGAATLAAVFVRNTPEELGQSADGVRESGRRGAGGNGPERAWHLAGAIRRAPFWAMSVASAFATGGFGLVLAHGVANARDAGHSAREAAFSLALVSLSGFAGKAIAGPGGDRLDPTIIWAGLMLAMGAGLSIAAVDLHGSALFAHAALLGAGFGGVVVCQPAAIARLFGTRHFAQIAGAVYFLQAIAGIAVPWIAGSSFDRIHSYRPTFAALAAGALISACLLLLYCRSVRQPAVVTA